MRWRKRRENRNAVQSLMVFCRVHVIAAQEEVFTMSVVTLIGAGQMASALTFPLFENGHEVRLVGSPLDDEIIDRLR